MNSVKNLKTGKHRIGSNFAYDFVRVTGLLPALAWFRFKIERPYGTKVPGGAVLLVANHNSMWDPVIVQLAFMGRRIHSLATSALFSSRLASTFFKWMHCVRVDNENFGMSAFRSVSGLLEQEKAVLIFPEGRINRENDMLSFKSGAVLMAYKAKASIVPMYIAPREKWYHRQHVVLGETIDVAAKVGLAPSMNEFQKLSEQIRQQELELMARFAQKNASGQRCMQ